MFGSDALQPDRETMWSTGLLLTPLVLGLLEIIVLEPSARAWHMTLNKSPYRPPNALFPLVWTWSYLSLGYASVRVAESVSGMPLAALGACYGVHLALLHVWGVCFYAQRRLDWALNVILVVVATMALLLAALCQVAPLVAVLCMPYFCWLLELTYLNIYMFRHNDSSRWSGASKKEVMQAYAR